MIFPMRAEEHKFEERLVPGFPRLRRL